MRLGFVTESAIRDIVARTIGQESIDLSQVVADSETLKLVSQDFARRNRMVPIAYDPAERMLTIATPEIFNVVAIDQLRAMLGPDVDIKTQFASEDQIEHYIDQFYGYELSVDGILNEIETGEIDYESLPTGGDGDRALRRNGGRGMRRDPVPAYRAGVSWPGADPIGRGRRSRIAPRAAGRASARNATILIAAWPSTSLSPAITSPGVSSAPRA